MVMRVSLLSSMKPFLYFLSGLLFPGLTWKKPPKNKQLYLTFDDGPHPVITPKVLNILDVYDAKATFFCVGENVKNYRDTYHEILKRGHKTGNHSFHHLNGWKTPNKEYISDVKACAEHVQSSLFRPPYGKIKPKQLKVLRKEGYSIIMWTVLAKDYREKDDKKTMLKIAIKKTIPGSIIVFHDSKKAADNLLYILPEFLEYFTQNGYSFKSL